MVRCFECGRVFPCRCRRLTDWLHTAVFVTEVSINDLSHVAEAVAAGAGALVPSPKYLDEWTAEGYRRSSI